MNILIVALSCLVITGCCNHKQLYPVRILDNPYSQENLKKADNMRRQTEAMEKITKGVYLSKQELDGMLYKAEKKGEFNALRR